MRSHNRGVSKNEKSFIFFFGGGKDLIEGGVNHTLSIDWCAWASCIRWSRGGLQVLLKLRCLGRRVCCLSLPPW